LREPVEVEVKTPEIRRKILARLNVMEREMRHVQSAMSALRGALQMPQPMSRQLADATMNSRNWVLSLAMSHAFIQIMLTPGKPAHNPWQFHKTLVPGESMACPQSHDYYSPGTTSLSELFSAAIDSEYVQARSDLLSAATSATFPPPNPRRRPDYP